MLCSMGRGAPGRPRAVDAEQVRAGRDDQQARQRAAPLARAAVPQRRLDLVHNVRQPNFISEQIGAVTGIMCATQHDAASMFAHAKRGTFSAFLLC